MTLAPESKVTLADGDTGKVEWTGTWQEFLTENEDDEELVEVRAKLERGEPAYVGGGAAAFFKVTVEPPKYHDGVVFNNQGRPVKVSVPLKE